MTKETRYAKLDVPKVLVLGVQTPYNRMHNIDSYFEEFVNLVKSNKTPYEHVLFIKLRSVDGAYFLTEGKLEEIQKFCQENSIDQVIISEPLSPQQERNLQSALHAKIFDRTRLILEIFEKSAQSAEGKKQVEIALLQYKKTRLAGRGIHLSQQAGRIGTRGPGETAKEKETQHLEQAILKLKRQLRQLEVTRQTQRKKRIISDITLICLIGYTNAGKSTILNTLTKSSVDVEDKLFVTLDTTTRELYIDSKKKALISDTVGFIQNLPHHLIEAFKSTLHELTFADLLLHIIDVSDSNWKTHIEVVNDILHDLKIDRSIVYVFNKIDKCTTTDSIVIEAALYQPHVIIEARSPLGIAPLVSFLRDWDCKLIDNNCPQNNSNDPL